MDAFQAARAAYLRGRGHSSQGDGMTHKGGLPSTGKGRPSRRMHSIQRSTSSSNWQQATPYGASQSSSVWGGGKGGGGYPNYWYEGPQWHWYGPGGGEGPSTSEPPVDWNGWYHPTPWSNGKGKGTPPLPHPRGGSGLFWEDALGTLPKDSQFYCEACEMDLCTGEALDKHKLTYHVKCPLPGCDYSAPPYMVESHKWTHMESKSKGDHDVASAAQPEEARAWLEERRKNFPGAAKKRRPSEMVSVESLKEVSESSSDSSDEEESEDTVVTPSDNQSEGHVEKSSQENEKDKPQEEVNSEALGDDNKEPSLAAAAAVIGVIKAPSEEENGEKVTKPKHGMCRFFLERGRCRHGDKCKYKHVRLTRQNKNKKNKRNHKQLVDQLKTFLAEDKEEEEESESELDSDSDEAI